MMNSKDLAARWGDERLASVNASIAAASRRKNLGPLPASPFGVTEVGKQDLRGIVLTEAVQYLTVKDADLSHAVCTLAGCLSLSVFTDCIFDSIKLEGRFATRRFERCSFRYASLKRAKLGDEFVDCSFESANLNKAGARGLRFVRCDFSGANLKEALLLQCSFEDCRFEGADFHNGSLGGSRFKGPVERSVFGNAILDGVQF